MNKQISSSIVGAVFVLTVVAVPALAQGRPEQTRAHGQGAEARVSAQERVKNIKEDIEVRRARIATEVCQRRQDRLQAAIPRLAGRTSTVKSVIDKIYERVQGFYDSGQLTVDNYEQLNDSVATAQADAAAAVEAVSEFEFELDCDQQGVGQQLDGFRTAISEAKEALKTYRTALVELISSLRAEAAESNANNETSNENSREEAIDDQE